MVIYYFLIYSALCDIGSAAFSYDMRRLTEILDVPKAWYKRSLMQRLFLGREGAYATQTSMNQTKSSTNNTPVPKHSSLADGDATDQNNPSEPLVIEAPQNTPTTNRSTKSSNLDPQKRTPGENGCM